MGFVGSAVLAGVYFGFAKRRFDLLSIAYVGAMFYFAPLFWGQVMQMGPELGPDIPPAVYFLASTYVLGLVFGGVLSQRFREIDAPADRRGYPVSSYYAALAVVGLIGSIVSTHGAIFNTDKVQTLKQVGYLYVLFEVAASLTCVSAVLERRWWTTAAGGFLLAIDLLVGFRPFVVITCLSVALVLLTRNGRVRFYSKLPSYGTAAVVLVGVMLAVHSVRTVIFDHIASFKGIPASERVISAAQMRSDTIQYEVARIRADPSIPSVVKLVYVPLKLFEQSEPFLIQANLVNAIRTNLSCKASNIFKSVLVLAPPGLAKLLRLDPFPETFYDEYKPILYPDITFGTGGNIWAEMYCRFGYVGVATFGILLILTLIGMFRLLLQCPSIAIAPIAFGGAVVAFYIHRNDLNYTLVMLRQTAIVFAIAYALVAVSVRLRRSRKEAAAAPGMIMEPGEQP
jgi:hypothetical protein